MKRIDRIYEYVKDKTENLTSKELELGYGVTTKEVAESLELERSNASKDLNQLVREGKCSKNEGRPVKYVDIKVKRHKPFSKYVPSYKEKKPSSTKANQDIFDYPFSTDHDIFQTIIGSSGSMKNAIEQAKAAVLYPPKGLNTLITGPTGSGKSFFAHAMFRFAQTNQCVANDKELIVFNCADYAHNPELLMSHLFGYTKGAFTGAAENKEGLIKEADGGMLFLDEIHRLPPEGQEMIFYFMDYGMYSRLGETVKTRKADVRIVGATTEDPGSTLLDTFMRRIPINIHLPAFKQRPASEKVDLVKVMVGLEANRIQRRISLTEDVVKALIASVGYGNIGQLKSNIQLVCAHGFMHQMHKDETVLTVNELPDGIKAGLIQLSSDRTSQIELAKYLEPSISISPNEPFIRMKIDSYELPYNLYDIIGDKAALLKAEGLDQEAINHYIATDINVHLKSFYRNHGFSFNIESKLSEFVDKEVIQLTHELYDLVQERLGEKFRQNFIYAMSLHISSFLKKIHLGEERNTNVNIRDMAVEFPEEYEMAQEIKEKISEARHVNIPESEVYYLTVLLVSLRDKEAAGSIGVVVAAHGNSTASSISNVVEQLLDIEKVESVDMPLDMPPHAARDRLEQAVTRADQGSGVMLLVDMGSLATFGDDIQEKTGISVHTMDMVTTALVIEAVRKASMVDSDLDALYHSLKKFRGYAEPMKAQFSLKNHMDQKDSVILAICASGEGTAKRIKEMVESALEDDFDHDLSVVACSVSDLRDRVKDIQKEYNIVATTGIMDPKLPAPFIPLEQFIENNIEHTLERIVQQKEWVSFKDSIDEESAQEICRTFMEESYTFINPQKLIGPLWDFSAQIFLISESNDETFAFYINLTLHMAGVIERTILKDSLSVDPIEMEQIKKHSMYSQLKDHIQTLEKQVKVLIPLTEYYYLLHFIEGHSVEKDEMDALLDNE